MGKERCILDVCETSQQINVVIKKPSLRYLDEFVRLNSRRVSLLCALVGGFLIRLTSNPATHWLGRRGPVNDGSIMRLQV